MINMVEKENQEESHSSSQMELIINSASHAAVGAVVVGLLGLIFVGTNAAVIGSLVGGSCAGFCSCRNK